MYIFAVYAFAKLISDHREDLQAGNLDKRSLTKFTISGRGGALQEMTLTCLERGRGRSLICDGEALQPVGECFERVCQKEKKKKGKKVVMKVDRKEGKKKKVE
ncbi:hypothetical protein CEXT_69861 [Caerostris extrusa]|uniref:Uncharacterized protein n=1 Tax=Caerostris extrusa TaxID=172846 RepID=A0AAV4UGZ8_CAEEX|nr:hypothetical protein CEXT_69861 [Caerostris extrusa]